MGPDPGRLRRRLVKGIIGSWTCSDLERDRRRILEVFGGGSSTGPAPDQWRPAAKGWSGGGEGTKGGGGRTRAESRACDCFSLEGRRPRSYLRAIGLGFFFAGLFSPVCFCWFIFIDFFRSFVLGATGG
ncbi:hypothetical protein VPH35_072720 [Triticum aestivum]